MNNAFSILVLFMFYLINPLFSISLKVHQNFKSVLAKHRYATLLYFRFC